MKVRMNPGWLGVLTLAALAGSSAPARSGSPPETLPWRELRFRARAAFVMGGELTLKTSGAEPRKVAAATGAPTDDCVSGPSLEEASWRLDASSRASFQPRTRTAIWLSSDDAAVRQVEHLREGRSFKLRRFVSGGHHEWGRKPGGRRERDLAPGSWTHVWEKHEDWIGGDVPLPDLPTTSSHALLVVATLHGLHEASGRELSFLVWSKGRPARVRLRSGGTLELGVDHLRRAAGSAVRVKERREARRVRLDGQLLQSGDTGASSAPVALLGISEGLELLLDVDTGVPLEIRGRAPGLGKLRARLTEWRPAGGAD